MSTVETILEAAGAGDQELVARLLREDPALATASSMLGVQPIHAAHFGGHQRVVDLLLTSGVKIDAFLASELGMLDLVNEALARDPEFATRFSAAGSTALHRSCYWGQVALATVLLKRGTDANAATRDSFLQIRPLGCAVATPGVGCPSDREEVVLELVRLLLEHGADVNGRRRDGLTALHSAGYRGLLQVIDVLLAAGADPSLAGFDGAGPHTGQRADDMAREQGQTEAAQRIAAARR